MGNIPFTEGESMHWFHSLILLVCSNVLGLRVGQL